MVYRIYVEKKDGFDHEAQSLTKEVQDLLEISSVKSIRVINRYDVEDIEKDLFDYAVKTVFSEPQMDDATETIESDNAKVFAVEYLPGQFDQRADSAAQCIQLISQKERPLVRTAKVYCVYGDVTEAELNQIKKHVINPVESRQASLEEVETLKQENEIPTEVQTLDGFIDLDRTALAEFVKNYGLAMDTDDIAFCQQYFISEKRNPTITEIRMIDTYWSDHCRHT
ncbi:MAG: phosphoribosylformylglycinamidine synthase, partial [Clostridia bacterium]|nr:phosphoribosylformylglycinamidine synthase [Clostridia bacterium]